MTGHLADRVRQISSRQRVTAAEEIDVREVPPAGVDRPSCDCGHDLLGVNHGERISPHDELTAEQARKDQFLWCRRDLVTHVDIEVEVWTGRGELGLHRDANAAVEILVSDHRCGPAVHVEHHTVVEAPGRDLAYDRPEVLGVVVERLGLEIDIAGRPPLTERSQEDPAFQDELVGEARGGQASQERLQDEEL